ncbi:SulP family inorganic anion transporter [Aureibaculum luteum]|uniref:SulP family inorganic anion transporter n=1 Tax=Aureibaculum luteum TaxID=1548456 RepID=UPI0013006EB8|nr:solute carrier family 26 protein [Aureibaculum luteum]
MNKFFPILDWLPNYKTSFLRGDIFAGLTIGIILIPQGIAYSIIAGLPPIYGLYTALIPQLIYTIFGTSKQLSTGPTALDSLIIASGVSTLAIVGTDNYITTVLLLTIMVGVLQFLVGIFRLGFIVNFLSRPVLTGFVSAAAIIIAFSQLKDLLGLDVARSNQIHTIIVNLFEKITEINLNTILIGLGSILIIYGLKKIHKKLPGQLLVVIIGILVMKWFGNYLSDVEIVKDIPKGLPPFLMHRFDVSLMQKLLPIALTLAFTGFLQGISIAKTLDEDVIDSSLKPNKELIALGLGNMVGSFFGAYTFTGSFSRSAINKEAGANTAMSNVVAALFILITILFLTPVFYYLPKTVLAAIIITAILGMIKVKDMRFLWKTDKKDFIMMLVTLIITLTVGIKEGIMVGVMVSIFAVIFETSRPHMAVLGKVPNTAHFYRNKGRFNDVEIDKEFLIVRFDSQLYFANTNYFKEKLDELVYEKGEDLRLIIIDAEVISNIDSSGVFALNELLKKYNSRGIKIYFTNIKGPLRDAFAKSGLIKQIGVENCFMSIQEAVNNYLNKDNLDQERKYTQYLDQVN